MERTRVLLCRPVETASGSDAAEVRGAIKELNAALTPPWKVFGVFCTCVHTNIYPHAHKHLDSPVHACTGRDAAAGEPADDGAFFDGGTLAPNCTRAILLEPRRKDADKSDLCGIARALTDAGEGAGHTRI